MHVGGGDRDTSCREVAEFLTLILHSAKKCAIYENNRAVAFNGRDSALNESLSL